MKARAYFLGARTSIQNVRAFPMYKTLGKLLPAINTPVNALWFRAGVGSFSSARFSPTGSLPVPNSFSFLGGKIWLRYFPKHMLFNLGTLSVVRENKRRETITPLRETKKIRNGDVANQGGTGCFRKDLVEIFPKILLFSLGNFSVVKKTSAEKRAQQYSYLCSKPNGLMYGNLHRE